MRIEAEKEILESEEETAVVEMTVEDMLAEIDFHFER